MRALTILFVSLALAACQTVPYDTFRRDGGASPNALGIMSGDIFYVGPRPQCNWTTDATPRATGITGNAIMLLFAYDNPPPPAGSATTALGLYSMNGDQLFNLADCMPLSPQPSDLEPITRTGHFDWPSIPLGTGPQATDGSWPTSDYQIRSFFDNNGDFNPFFSVRNLATAGDVGGGALVDAQAALPVFRRITFHNIAIEPEGEHIEGIAVTIGAIIDTERPMFVVDGATQALASNATIPLVADPIAQEAALWQLASMHFDLVTPDQTDTDVMMGTHPWAPALAAAGIRYDFSSRVHGMPVQPVDADGNGHGDPHPILGANGVNWYTPIVLLQRARNGFETAAGIPDVLLIGSVRPTVVGGVTQGFVQRETFSGADVIVPPVGVVVLNPDLPALCRVPYIPPGNIAELYQTQLNECQEIPSGNYNVNVLAGVAGARVVDVAADCITTCMAGPTHPDLATCTPGCQLEARLRTDTGFVYEGGQYSSQAWSVPNELGCPDSNYASGFNVPTEIDQLDPRDSHGHLMTCATGDIPPSTSVMLPSQSRAGGFAVVDTDASDEPAMADQISMMPTAGRGVAACQTALHTTGPMASMVGPIDRSAWNPAHVPAQCCAPIRHLCGLPLCPLRDATMMAGYPEAVRAAAGGVRTTREMRVPNVDFRTNADGSVTPLCLPFLMPVDCCQPM
jgi:hypothetical protein